MQIHVATSQRLRSSRVLSVVLVAAGLKAQTLPVLDGDEDLGHGTTVR